MKAEWFSLRRSAAVLIAFAGALFVFDGVAVMFEEFPRRPLDSHFMPPWRDHWWSEFIINFGLMFIIGCGLLWVALRLWKTKSN
jgi:hypothetical protein